MGGDRGIARYLEWIGHNFERGKGGTEQRANMFMHLSVGVSLVLVHGRHILRSHAETRSYLRKVSCVSSVREASDDDLDFRYIVGNEI